MRALALLLLAGCGAAPLGDPLVPVEDRTSGLTDVAADLEAVLERGTLRDACARYFAGENSARLPCGKAMFFYESFGTDGVPKPILAFLIDNFPDEIGAGFEKMGLIADPSSTEKLPLGLAPTVKFGGSVEALAFTCASCHFARLPDGRYAVGAPNHAYEYGRQNLAVAVFPLAALLGGTHDPAALAAIQPLLDRYQATPVLMPKLIAALTPLLDAGAMPPPFSLESERYYASWKPGTMDFIIEPLALDDRVHTVSKIPPLWEIPNAAEMARAGMPHAMLGWTGIAESVLGFVRGFVRFGGGAIEDWPDEKLQPLVDYVFSLQRTKNPAPPAAALVERGRALFSTARCTDCHAGPRGSGTRLFRYDEIGTDRAMERWLDPELTGKACCGAPTDDKPTHAIKSPRLIGSWAQSHFLHNGAVDSLEKLFCLDGPRGAQEAPPFSDVGHDWTCGSLSGDDKRALIAYLRGN